MDRRSGYVQTMRIIQKIERCIQTHAHAFSFEYYPPKDRDNWPAFYEKIGRMSRLNPAFIDVTWGTGDPTSFASIEIANTIERITGIETMMHLTCTHRSREELLDIVEDLLKNSPIRNIMALRGNRPPHAAWQKHPDGFSCAAELVGALRLRFGDALGIAVAGYPEGHREDGLPPSPEFVHTKPYFQQIDYTRKKIDAGADFIVTQLCFDMDQLCRYRDDCRKCGIQVPIVPGLLPIHSHKAWQKIAAFSASIPQELFVRYQAHQNDDEDQLSQFAIELLDEQIDRLHAEGFYAIHLYTLNHERLISRWKTRQR